MSKSIARAFMAIVVMLTVSTKVYAKTSLTDLEGGVVSVIASGDAKAGQMATALAKNGDTVVHVIAGSDAEVSSINKQILKAGLKGIVTVEKLGLKTLPYRDYLVNAVVVMNSQKAKSAGFTEAEARRVLAPLGKLVTCVKGKISAVEEIPANSDMDVWTHRYHSANAVPQSKDKVLKLTADRRIQKDFPLGFKWNAGLPHYFDNPKRGANRYASTRAMILDDNRMFTFSTAVRENLGASLMEDFGTDQYLTCRDAFNGRILWRKRVGDTYYGGLYIENTAPLISTGRHLYYAAENGHMLKVDTRTGETVKEFPTANIPGVIVATDGIVVTATWKNGEKMGSVLAWDRRRQDWAVEAGTIEAYDEKTGKLLWKNDTHATSLLVDDGKVFAVSRVGKDGYEYTSDRGGNQNTNLVEALKKGGKASKSDQENANAPTTYERPKNSTVAFDLKTGNELWAKDLSEVALLAGKSLFLQSAGEGGVVVSVTTPGADRTQSYTILSAETGEPMTAEKALALQNKLFKYRLHLCTPTFRVGDVPLDTRGGALGAAKGTRGACITGTIPAYGTAYTAQNWCKCSPGQISGVIAMASTSKTLTPKEMEKISEPVLYSKYRGSKDVRKLSWTTMRGNAERSSAVNTKLSPAIKQVWSSKVVEAELKEGTVKRDWNALLNSRLTAPVISESLAVTADMDHNEVIAVSLKKGTVAWRFPVAGRMDVPPTLYKGICLVGDYAGYVYALDLKTGKLIYKIRMAPEDTKMISYGKVESVWPVIGGVMIVDGKAYATCGRTIGIDGGFVVRSFVPETGKTIWAKAITPEQQQDRQQRPSRSDVLIYADGMIRMMDHHLDPNTGEFKVKPRKEYAKKIADEKKTATGEKLPHREYWNLRRQLEVSPEAPKELIYSVGGLSRWDWTHLGNRKTGDTTYGKWRGGSTMALGSHGVAFNAYRHNVILYEPKDAKPQRFNFPKEYLVTSMVLCDNAIVYGGVINNDPAKKGFIQQFNLGDKEPLTPSTYASKLAFNGLAVDNGTVVASFDDGSMVLLK